MKLVKRNSDGLMIYVSQSRLLNFIKYETIYIPNSDLVRLFLGGTIGILALVLSFFINSSYSVPVESKIRIEKDQVTTIAAANFYEYQVNGAWYITQENPDSMFLGMINKELEYEKKRLAILKKEGLSKFVRHDLRNTIRASLLQNVPAEYVDKYCPVIKGPKSKPQKKKKKKKPNDNKAQSFSNLGFVMNPTYAKRHKIDPAIVAEKQRILDDYLKRHSDIAVSEMKHYGIPASITLAQGLLESNAGDSRLAVDANNHFGIKCFSRSCKKGHCKNYTDDTHKDFFRVYESVWESYRAHSLFLQRNRYKHLLKLKKRITRLGLMA